MVKLRGLMILGIAAGLLSFAAIRKNEDPIQRTQTDGITYKQKLEETKDGVKGAPSPSFTYYSRNEFLTTSPMATSTEEIKNAENDLDASGEWVSEDREFEEQPAQEDSGDEWWIEEGTEEFDAEEEQP